MVDHTKRREVTYQDVFDAPKHMVAEIIDGELVLSPRPAFPHAISTYALNDELISLRQGDGGGTGGWFFLFEPELHLANDVVVPDLAAWRRDRIPAERTGAATTVAPDWVCETLSKSTQRIDRVKKVPIYAREGIGHVWLLDERVRLLEVYRLNTRSGAYDLVDAFGEGQVVRAEPFTELELRLSSLFRDLPVRAGEAFVDYGR
jgi:Uma2 family endonuclease